MNKPVAVLCGGKGIRLGWSGQKCLVPVKGRPFLGWKLDQLQALGATEIHLLLSYRASDVFDYVNIAYPQWCPIFTHEDDGTSRERAHKLALPNLPYFHWLTYGDCLLDAPLVHRPFPYIYTNEEFLQDAGLMYCFGGLDFHVPRYTRSPSFHCNTPSDLERLSANLY